MLIIKTQSKTKRARAKGECLKVTSNIVTKLIDAAKNTPNKTAIHTSTDIWSYQNLYDNVCRWKNIIGALAITTPIIICIHRSPKLIAILITLQWLKIPYIPLELSTPIKRIKAIIEDSKASILLYDTNCNDNYASLPCKTFSINDLEKLNPTKANQGNENNAENLLFFKNPIAYIIYTSGSTGVPKGVSISQKALNNFLTSMSEYFFNNDTEMLLATTTISFDIAALEIYLPIWKNKSLFLANQDEHKDPYLIQDILNNYPITLAQGTTSFWNLLFYSGWKGKNDLTVLCGGEPLTKQIIQNILPNVKQLWNMYGPTEATVWCSLKQITNDNITVGKPIHNTEMLVLDKSLRMVAKNTKGELYIGGDCLANGYINHKRLTNDKFIIYKSAFSFKRLYRTGDIAYMNDNDEFIILGRVDNQVKLHGYRIELEEVELHIQANIAIRECLVDVYQEQLIAYICIANKEVFSEDYLILELNQKLPEYMIPKRFVYLESLPLNSNGKLNRNLLNLPSIEQNSINVNLTNTQKSLISIWQDILNVNNINIESNFFELGGHSLLAARIVTQISNTLNKKIKMHSLYHAQNIKELAELVDSTDTHTKDVVSTKINTLYSWIPLSDFQLTLWVSHIFAHKIKGLNIVDRRRIATTLDLKILNYALQKTINNNQALLYKISKIFPMQKINDNYSISWQDETLQLQSTLSTERYLNKSIKKLQNISWKKNKPLIIAKVYYLNNGSTEIQIAISHMVSDKHSIEIFFQQLSAEYLNYNSKLQISSTAKKDLYANYSVYEQQHIKLSIKNDNKFWNQYLKDADLLYIPEKNIIFDDIKNHSNESYSSLKYSSSFKINESLISKLKEVCVKHTISINDLLCGALAQVLYENFDNYINNSDSLIINIVKSTRDDPVYDKVIGCFLKIHPIKLKISGDDIIYLAKQAQKSSIETFDHQHTSGLIKLAALCKTNSYSSKILYYITYIFAKLYGKLPNKNYKINATILNACAKLSSFNKKKAFLININVWDNFFTSKPIKQSHLFNTNLKQIPTHNQYYFKTNGVLDICLLRNSERNEPHLVISANLNENMRCKIGSLLLKALENL